MNTVFRHLVATLILLAALAPVAAQDSAALLKTGFEQLADRQLRQAEASFQAVLEREPENLGAHEGLVYVYMGTGEYDRLRRHAAARQALAPQDQAWQSKRADILREVQRLEAAAGQAPQGLESLEASLRRFPRDLGLRLRYAQQLSWIDGRLGDAIVEYRKAVALAPRSVEARRGLAQALSWNGDAAAAAELYDELLGEVPNDPDVLLGRAQVARWQGDRSTAAELLARGRQQAPDDARFWAEQARLDLDNGQRGAAARAARKALDLDPQLDAAKQAQEAVAQALATRAQGRLGATDESEGFASQSVDLRLETYPWADTRLRIGPGMARYEDDVDELDRPYIGAGVQQTLPGGLRLGVAYAAFFPEDVQETHAVQGDLTWRAARLPLGVTLGARRRALVDTPVGYEDIADFGGIGSGGSTVGGIRARLQSNEAFVEFSTSPLPSLYGYLNLVAGELTDDNQRRAIAAGFGLNIAARLSLPAAHALTLKYDFYDLAYEEPSSLYFSPDSFQVHAPGVDWRVQRGGHIFGLEASVPVESGEAGYKAGGFFRYRLNPRLTLDGRARIFDDTQFRVVSLMLGPRYRF